MHSCRVKSEVLKSIKDNDALELVSGHLFGQLEGYVNSEDPAIAKRWEVSIGYPLVCLPNNDCVRIWSALMRSVRDCWEHS